MTRLNLLLTVVLVGLGGCDPAEKLDGHNLDISQDPAPQVSQSSTAAAVVWHLKPTVAGTHEVHFFH